MGVLTQHGYDAVKRMGEFQRTRYQKLLTDSQCAAAVYCEENMPRDERTAEAFFAGLNCKLPPLITDDSEFLIDQGSHPRGDDGECALGTEAQVEGRVGGDVKNYQNLYPYNALIEKLSDLLGCCAPELCKSAGAAPGCSLSDMPSAWDDHWYTTFTGPMYAGKYFGEWIMLTMLNGMGYAWGKLSVEEVMELAVFVTQYRAFEFDLPSAQAFGSTLTAHLVATLQHFADDTAEVAGLVSHGRDARLVYYAAHDTNLLYVGTLLGLKWINSGGWQPNHTPPGGALVFEAYSPSHPDNPLNEWQVAAFFDIQTPQQVRDLTKLGGKEQPSRSPISIPRCSAGPLLLCPLSKLTDVMRRVVRPECITPLGLRSFAALSHPVTMETGGGAGGNGLSLFFAFVAIVLTVLACLFRKRLQQFATKGKCNKKEPEDTFGSGVMYDSPHNDI